MRFRVRLGVGPSSVRRNKTERFPNQDERTQLLHEERSLARSPPRLRAPTAFRALGRRSERNEGSPGSSSWRGPARSRCRVGPTPQFRNLRRMPFRGLLPFARESNQSKGPPLATTHSRPIAVHAKPFSTSVHKGHTCVVATPTKICTRDPSTRAHAQASAAIPTPPYFFLSPHKEKEPRLPRLPLQRHPFSGLQNSAGELLHTP